MWASGETSSAGSDQTGQELWYIKEVAIVRTTSRSCMGPTTVGLKDRAMALLFWAICVTAPPRNWLCSSETEVTTLTALDRIKLVASCMPPMPHSITATSTLLAMNMRKATSVSTSNSVKKRSFSLGKAKRAYGVGRFWKSSSRAKTHARDSSRSSSDTGRLLMRIESRSCTSGGDTNKPVVSPDTRSVLSVMAHTMPFPFVPAT
ncbi:hypothetical protein CAOG_010097 [Capsaspora owczarzaki ATCC 30864]|uniref:Uncharacterized protein n=1 Tax=Capsaspora owczarzaki (strain ATCC 30864) TaxID=595528 RepID=A0A0D2VZG6_CAPO3|nr:hypothetical protein CAOG_010097 [Capsaspora owczarzaki ATCC 30864]